MVPAVSARAGRLPMDVHAIVSGNLPLRGVHVDPLMVEVGRYVRDAILLTVR